MSLFFRLRLVLPISSIIFTFLMQPRCIPTTLQQPERLFFSCSIKDGKTYHDRAGASFKPPHDNANNSLGLSPSSMEPFPAFHAKRKRHAMLFRRPSPPQASSPCPTPDPNPPNITPRTYHSHRNAPSSSLDAALAPAHTTPRSRKTSHTTILTDSGAAQPAFESDAFAIHMPTTREPILEPAHRTRQILPSPSPPPLPSPGPELGLGLGLASAQAEAYRTYARKAAAVRVQDRELGVRVPSRIVGYDYACSGAVVGGHGGREQEQEREREREREKAPAGSFPASPVLSPRKVVPRVELKAPVSPASMSRGVDGAANIAILRRPLGARSVSPRGDAGTGAAATPPTGTPTKTRMRVRSRVPVVPPATVVRATTPRGSPPGTPSSTAGAAGGSFWGGYSARSPVGSRSGSPEKGVGSLGAVFGYTAEGVVGIEAAVRNKDKEKEKEAQNYKHKPKEKEKDRSTRWAWFRAPGGKPVKQPLPPPPTPSPRPPKKRFPAIYESPFTSLPPATPLPPRTPSPRKLHRNSPPPPPVSTPQAQAQTRRGLSQLSALFCTLFKIAAVLYLLVAVYFLVQAVVGVVWALGAPFRVLGSVGRVVWTGGTMVAGVLGRAGAGAVDKVGWRLAWRWRVWAWAWKWTWPW
ncbi:hypothetical protein BS50DRAFT_664514 [Corynespora cassiicola Philippines]|uniref:Uncharacterized protein n=1 Tax=Corynespora cassiicola Philippines TaxID=1448308 RepID=A0A2T2NVN5_CORCC|nr:hypothetical protein BS50DRAFT_664514 [Corynespora cassiicola Philippines]